MVSFSKRFEELFWTSKAGLAAKAEIDKQQADERKAHEKAIGALDARLAKEGLALAETKKKALEAKLAAEHALHRATRELGRAMGAQMAFEATIARDKAQHERAMTELGSEDLKATLDRLDAMREATMAKTSYQTEKELETIGTGFWGGPIKREVMVRDNLKLLGARMTALREADEEARHLVATKADYRSALEKIPESVPSSELPGASK